MTPQFKKIRNLVQNDMIVVKPLLNYSSPAFFQVDAVFGNPDVPNGHIVTGTATMIGDKGEPVCIRSYALKLLGNVQVPFLGNLRFCLFPQEKLTTD